MKIGKVTSRRQTFSPFLDFCVKEGATFHVDPHEISNLIWFLKAGTNFENGV